jgi:transposase InsO family protein
MDTWSAHHADLAFRYALISPLLDPQLSKSDKMVYRRCILARDHAHPTRGRITVSARTLRRWLRECRIRGQDGLHRRTRRDRGPRILEPKHLEYAVELLKENSLRNTEFLIAELEYKFNDLKGRVKCSTLNRHLHALGVWRRAHPEETAEGAPYRSFQANQPNDLWHSDCHHGPNAIDKDGKVVPTRIFAWLDDFSRICCHCQAYAVESLPSLEHCFQEAMSKFGIPKRVYTDRGAVYSGTQFSLICADLGIYPIPTTGYTPWKHGKMERQWGVQDKQFWREIAQLPPLPLAQVNHYLQAWVEGEYHQRVHSSTGEAPLARWKDHRPQVTYPTPEQLKRLFWIWERRKVTTTAVIKHCKNEYHVDPALAGRWVLVRYAAYDLEQIQVWTNEKPPRLLCEGTATPLFVRKELSPPPPSDRPKISAAAQRRVDTLEKRFQDYLAQSLELIRLNTPQEGETPT